MFINTNEGELTLVLEIKAELVRQKKTIEQLAKSIGISRGNLSEKLNNHIGFRSDELQKIGEALTLRSHPDVSLKCRGFSLFFKVYAPNRSQNKGSVHFNNIISGKQ